MTGRAGLLLGALAVGSFLITLSGGSMAPFLGTMAAEFGVSFGTIAHLFSFQAAAWGASALVAGRLSDRIGRRPLILASLAGLTLSRFGLALAGGYPAAVLWQTVSGVCGGAFTSAAFAAVSDYAAPERRGRSLGWLITGQSLSLLAGIPLLTLLAAAAGWRGAVNGHGGAALLLGLLLALVLPRATKAAPEEAKADRASLAGALDRRLMQLLVSGLLERVTFACIAIYLASFLTIHYGVAFAELSLGLAIAATGNLVGSVLGGRLADRGRNRIRLFALSLAATGVCNLLLMLHAPGYAISIFIAFATMFANAMGRPAYLAMLSDAPARDRGALMGLNVMLGSLSWFGAALVGGLVQRWGFGVVAVFSAVTAGAASAIAFGIERSHRRRQAG